MPFDHSFIPSGLSHGETPTTTNLVVQAMSHLRIKNSLFSFIFLLPFVLAPELPKMTHPKSTVNLDGSWPTQFAQKYQTHTKST